MINLDKANLEKMIAEKYISVQKHPILDLYIYNYTQKAQFDRMWNNETLQCRGLIMDGNGNIIARPFKKFFNLQEAIDKGEQIPSDYFVVTEKMDGSLGILYSDGVRPCIATRGSFISEQAIKGSTMVPFGGGVYWDPDFTYLFEIIYPQNRIVVDYGLREELVLLTVIRTETGEELSYEDVYFIGRRNGLSVVEKHEGIKDFSKIEQKPNSEGYVILFPTSGQRFKIKFDEYVRLHRLVTGVNARTIWDLLRNNQDFTELLDKVPDEFYDWVKRTRDSLQEQYNFIESVALKHYEEKIKDLPTRKDQALAIKAFDFDKAHEIGAVIFAMLNKKPYESIIWKLLKPGAEKPFKEDKDA